MNKINDKKKGKYQSVLSADHKPPLPPPPISGRRQAQTYSHQLSVPVLHACSVPALSFAGFTPPKAPAAPSGSTARHPPRGNVKTKTKVVLQTMKDKWGKGKGPRWVLPHPTSAHSLSRLPELFCVRKLQL